MASFCQNPKQDISTRTCLLHRRGKFFSMIRWDIIILFSRLNISTRILGSLMNVVVRRITLHVLKIFVCSRISIFCHIHRSPIIQTKMKHICMWNTCNHAFPQRRFHCHQCSYQQSSIASTTDRGVFWCCPSILHYCLCDINKIVKYIFLVQFASSFMPLRSIFFSTSQNAMNI